MGPCIAAEMTPAVNEERIWQVWGWVQEEYLRHKRRLTFPTGTDPRKTYHWRYLRAIVEKFDRWDLDADTSRRYLAVAVARAAELKLLHKGLSAVHQRNLLEATHAALKKHKQSSKCEQEMLRGVAEWMRRFDDPLGALLKKPNPDAPSQVVVWYQANKLTGLYLALSICCLKALAVVAKKSPEQRRLVPSSADLHLLWARWTSNKNNLAIAREILGDDLRTI